MDRPAGDRAHDSPSGHGARALRRAAGGGPGRPGRSGGRPRTYGEDVLEPLLEIRATLDGPCGKRPAPFMEEMVEVTERCGELRLTPEVRGELLSISAAGVDRLLAPQRRRLRVEARSGTEPGTLLRSQIPIRTHAGWDERRPGFCEVDLVGHEGGDPSGQFCQTLNLTCVATGWTEMRALPKGAQRWVFEALREIEEALPFPLLGLDPEGGAEFINAHLFEYRSARGITAPSLGPPWFACKRRANGRSSTRSHRTDPTARYVCPDRTREHSTDRRTRATAAVHELQNRCAGESRQAGSIPVRLREGIYPRCSLASGAPRSASGPAR